MSNDDFTAYNAGLELLTDQHRWHINLTVYARHDGEAQEAAWEYADRFCPDWAEWQFVTAIPEPIGASAFIPRGLTKVTVIPGDCPTEIDESLRASTLTARQANGATFKDFLKEAEATDDAVGDLIKDCLRDRTLPDDMLTQQHFRRYLRLKSACSGALSAASGLWDRYEDWLSA